VIEEALRNPSAFVMKPQREGGGNNLYGAELGAALQQMSAVERAGYILMERILPPAQGARMMRGKTIFRCDRSLCELGIFSVFLGSSTHVMRNKYAGYLLRVREHAEPAYFVHVVDISYLLLRHTQVKAQDTDEGGVAAGFAVLSAPLLYSAIDTWDEDEFEKTRNAALDKGIHTFTQTDVVLALTCTAIVGLQLGALLGVLWIRRAHRA
jgi:glutathione synthase